MYKLNKIVETRSLYTDVSGADSFLFRTKSKRNKLCKVNKTVIVKNTESLIKKGRSVLTKDLYWFALLYSQTTRQMNEIKKGRLKL